MVAQRQEKSATIAHMVTDWTPKVLRQLIRESALWNRLARLPIAHPLGFARLPNLLAPAQEARDVVFMGSVTSPVHQPRSLGSRVRLDVFYSSDISHPISHRTPHYRVGNGVIGWLVIIQKRLNFRMKRNCTIQDSTAGNGLGNRCLRERPRTEPQAARPSPRFPNQREHMLFADGIGKRSFDHTA